MAALRQDGKLVVSKTARWIQHRHAMQPKREHPWKEQQLIWEHILCHPISSHVWTCGFSQVGLLLWLSKCWFWAHLLIPDEGWWRHWWIGDSFRNVGGIISIHHCLNKLSDHGHAGTMAWQTVHPGGHHRTAGIWPWLVRSGKPICPMSFQQSNHVDWTMAFTWHWRGVICTLCSCLCSGPNQSTLSLRQSETFQLISGLQSCFCCQLSLLLNFSKASDVFPDAHRCTHPLRNANNTSNNITKQQQQNEIQSQMLERLNATDVLQCPEWDTHRASSKRTHLLVTHSRKLRSSVWGTSCHQPDSSLAVKKVAQDSIQD